MASKRGGSILIEQAENRVNHLLPALAAFLGIDIQPMPTHRDPLQQKVLQTQWLADALEAIDRAVVPLVDAIALKAEIDRLTAELEDMKTATTAIDPPPADPDVVPEPAEIPAPEGEPGNPDDEEPAGDDTAAQDGEETTAPENPAPEGEGQVQAVDRDALKELKLDELKALAIDAGADPEAVAKMRAKDDVINAIAGQEITEP